MEIMELQSQFRNFERRIDELGASVRTWRAVSLLAGLLVLVLFATGMDAPAPRIVSAEEIQLVDAQGKVRGFLGIRDGQPGFALLGDDSRPRAALRLDQVGRPTLAFLRPDGLPVIALSQEPVSHGLILYNRGKGAAIGAGMTVNDDGSMLNLCDTKGTGRVTAATNDADSGIVIYDSGKTVRAAVYLEKDSSKVEVRDSKGGIQAAMP